MASYNGIVVILHVAVQDKFIPSFIELVNEEFQGENHQFWISGPTRKYPIDQSKNTYICTKGVGGSVAGHIRLIKQLHEADKILLHGLFDIKVIALLALCPWLLSKCYWVVWGGDLYQYKKTSQDWRYRGVEPLRRFLIRRFGHLVTYIPGDIELARQWYGAKGLYHECIMYLSNVVETRINSEVGYGPGKKSFNVLLGNSADPSNNHIEALERLRPFENEIEKIYAPLSYGDQSYAKLVIHKGNKWFGEKFEPMTEFIPFPAYLEFLSGLDVAIFNHRRQQAMGNTIMLLSMGKTVFMRSDMSHWRFLNNLGVKLMDVENLTLQQLEPYQAKENARVVRSYFSRATLVKQLAEIFEG